MRPKITLIVATDLARGIGRDGDLPWRMPSDLKRFKSRTMGLPIVMGRITHESIGRALPGRKNIIITRDSEYSAKGCTVVHSIDDAIAEAADAEELLVIGGAEIYRLFMEIADAVDWTRIEGEFDCDTFLDEFPTDFVETRRESVVRDPRDEAPYSVVFLERNPASA